jgi:hypothetical protein
VGRFKALAQHHLCRLVLKKLQNQLQPLTKPRPLRIIASNALALLTIWYGLCTSPHEPITSLMPISRPQVPDDQVLCLSMWSFPCTKFNAFFLIPYFAPMGCGRGGK